MSEKVIDEKKVEKVIDERKIEHSFDIVKYVKDRFLLHLGPTFSFAIIAILILLDFCFFNESSFLTHFGSGGGVLVLIQQYFRFLFEKKETSLKKNWIVGIIIALVCCYFVYINSEGGLQNISVGVFSFYIMILVFCLDIVSGECFKKYIKTKSTETLLWLLFIFIFGFLIALVILDYFNIGNWFYIITSLFIIIIGGLYGKELLIKNKK